MTTPGQWTDLIGSTAIDSDGEKVGKIGQIYLDDATGQPAWITVSTGLFGMRESVAPLYNAQPSQGEVRLAVTKQMIKDAPNIDADAHLTESETGELYQYYANYLDPSVARTGADQPGNGDYATGTTGTGTGYDDRDARYADRTGTGAGTAGYDEAGVTGTRDRDASGLTGDDAMTRSEERLNVGTENVTAGQARLRK
jgi:PRC-barrel domain protein